MEGMLFLEHLLTSTISSRIMFAAYIDTKIMVVFELAYCLSKFEWPSQKGLKVVSLINESLIIIFGE
jgi:hypothetical protein